MRRDAWGSRDNPHDENDDLEGQVYRRGDIASRVLYGVWIAAMLTGSERSDIQEMKPNLAYLSLGSNIEPEKNLKAAVALLSRFGRVLRASTV